MHPSGISVRIGGVPFDRRTAYGGHAGVVNNGRSLLMRPAASGRARGRAGGQACPLVPRCALRYARRCTGRRATAHRLEPDPCRHSPRCGAPRVKVPTDREPNAPDFCKPTECRRRCAGAGSQTWDGVYHDTRIYDHVWVYIHKYMDISMLVNSHHVWVITIYQHVYRNAQCYALFALCRVAQ